MTKVKYVFSVLKLAVYIIFPLVILVLPGDYFDTGQSISLFELAGLKDYFSKGLTRACMHLIHLDFKTAWEYNRLAFIIVPPLSILWLTSFLKDLDIYFVTYHKEKNNKVSMLYFELRETRTYSKIVEAVHKNKWL